MNIPQVTSVLFLWDFPIGLKNSREDEPHSTTIVKPTSKKYEIVHRGSNNKFKIHKTWRLECPQIKSTEEEYI